MKAAVSPPCLAEIVRLADSVAALSVDKWGADVTDYDVLTLVSACDLAPLPPEE